MIPFSFSTGSLRVVLIAFSALFTPLVSSAQAQTYPAKPIRLIVGFSAGGVADSMARLVARRLGERLGQQIYVENRAGANGIIAADQAARAEPDGYTLLLGEVGPNAINASLYSKLPYDPRQDFVPVSRLTSVTAVLVASQRSGIKSADAMIQMAKGNPGKLSYSSAGAGHVTHIGVEAISMKNNISLVHVPYKGGAPALQDVVANMVDLNIASISTARGFIQQGKVHAIAVTSPNRNSAMPEVPTFAEAELTNFPVDGWHGLFAPKGTPPEIVRLLNRETNEVLKVQEVRDAMSAAGVEAVGGTSDEFREFVSLQIDLWGEIVRRIGIKLE